MNECKNINNFVKNNDLLLIKEIFYCECNYCKKYDTKFNIFYSKIMNDEQNIKIELDNKINLIWTNSMIFIKKYLLLFDKFINI